jgi:hypothetical protein
MMLHYVTWSPEATLPRSIFLIDPAPRRRSRLHDHRVGGGEHAADARQTEILVPGIWAAGGAPVFGHDRHQFWHIVHAFLTMPPRRDQQQPQVPPVPVVRGKH